MSSNGKIQRLGSETRSRFLDEVGNRKEILIAIASMLFCVAWPFANFLSHNKHEIILFGPFFRFLLLAIAIAFLFGLFLRLSLHKWLQLFQSMPTAGAAVAFFFSYQFVREVYRKYGWAEDTLLVLWFALFCAVVMIGLFVLRKASLRPAFALATFVMVCLPTANFIHYSISYETRSPLSKPVQDLSSAETAKFLTGRQMTPEQQERPNSFNVVDQEIVRRFHEQASLSDITPLPNVYMFILDGYNRNDNLKKHYRFDNSDFLNFLESKGFYIAQESYSNYPVTWLSINTTLNMDYYLGTGPGAALISKDDPFRKYFLGSHYYRCPALVNFLKRGYHLIFANVLGTKVCGGAHCIGGSYLLRDQDIVMLQMTPMFDFLCRYSPKFKQRMTDRIVNNPESIMAQLPSNAPKPFFFFAHLLAPHPPYMYRADGSVRDLFEFDFDPEIRDAEGDAEDKNLAKEAVELARDGSQAVGGADAFQRRMNKALGPPPKAGKNETFIHLYTDQIRALNQRMMRVIDNIIKIDPDAIIILQSDHGWRKGTLPPTDVSEWLRMRFGIINAVRSSKRCRKMLYSSISLVNTFRFLFACVDGTNPDYIPDKSFASSSDTGDLMEITESLALGAKRWKGERNRLAD